MRAYRALRWFGPLLFFLLLLLAVPATRAHGPGDDDPAHDEYVEEPSDPLPAILASASFEQRLGEPAPLDLRFADESGRMVSLAEYAGEKPVILTMNYFKCDSLCPLTLDAVARGLKLVRPYTIGDEFEVVTVSIDAREGPSDAAATKEHLVQQYARDGAAQEGWHFLTGSEENVAALAEAVGVRYAWDEEGQQWAHPSGMIFLSPGGTIARYIYGIEYSPRDLRLALVEASEGTVSTPVDQVLLFCFRYNPLIGQYGAIAVNAMRIAGLVTMVVLGGVLLLLFRRERGDPPAQAMA